MIVREEIQMSSNKGSFILPTLMISLYNDLFQYLFSVLQSIYPGLGQTPFSILTTQTTPFHFYHSVPDLNPSWRTQKQWFSTLCERSLLNRSYILFGERQWGMKDTRSEARSHAGWARSSNWLAKSVFFSLIKSQLPHLSPSFLSSLSSTSRKLVFWKVFFK